MDEQESTIVPMGNFKFQWELNEHSSFLKSNIGEYNDGAIVLSRGRLDENSKETTREDFENVGKTFKSLYDFWVKRFRKKYTGSHEDEKDLWNELPPGIVIDQIQIQLRKIIEELCRWMVIWEADIFRNYSRRLFNTENYFEVISQLFNIDDYDRHMNVSDWKESFWNDEIVEILKFNTSHGGECLENIKESMDIIYYTLTKGKII